MTRTPARRLAEVAKKVGVSEATVSRVLNGKPGVSDSTRETVLTALDVLGYERPSKLRGQRARLIGLVVPELQNPIFPALAEVIGGAAAPHDHYRLLRGRGVPVVLINAAIDNLDFPCVATDDASAATQAFTHLSALGHDRIGLVLGPDDHMPSRRKLAGFTEAAQRAGITIAPV